MNAVRCHAAGDRACGFTLVELAIVMVVLGVMMRAAVMPLAALEKTRRERQQQDGVALAREVLIAHLIAHGSLPCPRAPDASDEQRSDSNGRCRTYRGGLPARALAWPGPIDASGAALDPWGRPYVYALSDSDHATRGVVDASDWIDSAEIGAVGLTGLRGSLSLCTEDRSPCPMARLRANDLVFVVLSHGADASEAGRQRQNRSGDTTFTLAPPSVATETRYDDAIVWASRSELLWWLLRAGRLP